MDDGIITLTLEDGTKKDFNIIFEFYKNKKRYVTYTDYDQEMSGDIKCYSSILDGDKTIPVEDEEDLKLIDSMLKTISQGEYKKIEQIEE